MDVGINWVWECRDCIDQHLQEEDGKCYQCDRMLSNNELRKCSTLWFFCKFLKDLLKGREIGVVLKEMKATEEKPKEVFKAPKKASNSIRTSLKDTT